MKGARESRKGNLKGTGSWRRKREGRISSRRRKKDREIELARIAAKEAKADKESGLERDRIAAQEKERADKLAAQEKDREIE